MTRSVLDTNILVRALIKPYGTILAGNAEFVVTGDEDLLVVKQYETVRFVTPGEFLAILGERESGD